MLKFKQLFGALILAVSVMTVPVATGCKSAQLSQTGPYHGDKILYNADKTISTSYKVMHDFVTWEYNNRNVLPLQVTQAADAVRANAKKSIDAAIAVRDAYANQPSTEAGHSLDTALNILSASLAEATKLMAGSTTANQ